MSRTSAANTASQTAEDDVTALEARVQSLEDQLGGAEGATAATGAAAGDLEKRLSAVEADIAELRKEVEGSGNGSSGAQR